MFERATVTRSRTGAAAALILVLTFALPTAGAVEAPGAWSMSGELQALALRSHDLNGASYEAAASRLRLKFKGIVGPAARIDLQYEHELRGGSVLQTMTYAMEQAAVTPPYWRLQSTYLERGDLIASHGLHRISLSLDQGDSTARFGRQRIAWGVGRIWSPLDRLNPPPVTTLDRSERAGVDALLLEHRFGAVARLSAAVAMGHDRASRSQALRWHGTVSETEYSVVTGRFKQDRVTGLDLTHRLGDAIVRAEWARIDEDGGNAHDRTLLGADLAFANTLNLAAEFYQDGSGADRLESYDFEALARGRRSTLGRRYLGLQASIESSPRVRWHLDAIVNLVDQSRYLAPSVVFEFRPDADVTAGLQSFAGRTGSEFGLRADAAYLRFRWFF